MFYSAMSISTTARKHRSAWVPLVGAIIAGVSQAGVWWVPGFQTVCPAIMPPQCGLAIGRTGAATIGTALTLLSLVVLVAAWLLSSSERRSGVRTAFVVHVGVSLAAVLFTLFSTGFVVPF